MRVKVSFILIILAPLALILGFQNCSSETPFADPTGGPVEKLITGEPFPYNASFDQIAYMSCSEQGGLEPDPQTFFTFRIGAYRNSGLTLSQEFQEETQKMNEDQKVSILSQQLVSAGTQMQFALRSTGNFQLPFVSEENGAGGAQNFDYSNIFTVMGDEALTANLLQTPAQGFMNTFASAPFQSQYRFEGNLNFAASEIIQRQMRSFLSREGMLALTFSEESTISPRGPGYLTGDARDLGRNVYGFAVQLKFRQPLPDNFRPTVPYPGNAAVINVFEGQAPSTDMPPRLLASVEEIIIDKRFQGTPPKTWLCPDTMAFRIVLPNQAAAENCRMEPDPLQASAILRAVRQSLYVEDWYIDVENRCAVPKSDRVHTGACYGIDSNRDQTRIIEYDMTKNCGLNTTGIGACPHFVSICVRDNL